MASGVRVSGTYRNITPHVKVAGVWKAPTGYVKVAGVWRQWTAAGGGGVGPCTISGGATGLNGSASTANVAGTAQTVTVALGNTGGIQVRNLIEGSGTAQIKIATGSFISVVENDILTFASADNIQCRGLAMTSATSIFFDLYDYDTGTFIKAVTLTRT